MKIEDYAFLSDTQTGALVGKNASIDWLCFPRFDSRACFASLLGSEKNGRWIMQPVEEIRGTSRRYRGDTLVLETDFETESGVARVIDFMPPRGTNPDIIRIVEGIHGEVRLRTELIMRFDYGAIVPWVRNVGGDIVAIAGPDALIFRTPIQSRGHDLTTVAEFTVNAGRRVPFVLTWFPSHEKPPKPVDAENALRDTISHWEKWAAQCTYDDEWRDAVMRSLLTLKGLTYAPTGGIIAAATTSLPEKLGGVRNWDYRYCWLRDATFTLDALLGAGYRDEAREWRDWLLRAVAGSARQTQILYGPAGERRIEEFELPWLDGYENSKPVRIGNAASKQFQLDVYGEVMDVLHLAHRAGVRADPWAWRLQLWLLKFLEKHWDEPDEGIWEVRGPRRHFTHSKVMAWVAVDRAVRAIEYYGFEGDLAHFKKLRKKIHDEVCERGYSRSRKAFTQYYGSKNLDASVLMLPLVGFLPAEDERVKNTIETIQDDLMRDGFLLRYRPDKAEDESVDGLPPGEGAFLPCTFWLCDCLHLLGRNEEAREIFQRLLDIRNDLGLLAEEYDTHHKRQIGNFPQAFSHVGLVNTAQNLTAHDGPARHRCGAEPPR